jgi:acetyl-CoA carboxylase alpha subunit
VTDWRDGLLERLRPIATIPDSPALRAGQLTIGQYDAIAAAWDFTVRGGSFGEAEATTFSATCRAAIDARLPLVTLLRSGGTRLQEGMRSLVGIPRAVLALEDLAHAQLAHVTVADQPTTGGVWVAVGSAADVRIGVAGATVGFSGPRVVEAMTGVTLHPGANTAESALAAGLLDAVAPGHEVVSLLGQVLRILDADEPAPVTEPRVSLEAARTGWDQVVESRETNRPTGEDLLTGMLDEWFPLRCTGDDSVFAAIGRLAGRRVCGVALARQRAGRVTPGGYDLLSRAAAAAGRLDLPLVVLVDTAGADPLPDSEAAGVARALRSAMASVLDCASPSVCVVHGEGGSGGALAGAVTDVVGVTGHGWFAALAPEGAAATLRLTPPEAADVMSLTPGDLVSNGFADSLAPSTAATLAPWLAMRIDGLRAMDAAERLQRRRSRWSAPLGQSPEFSG